MMESKINTIGLTIWGYKQGCKVLSSQGVNFQLQEVKDRLKDISAFIRIHTPRVDFYTLQFTQNYRIYTQYRSSREVNGQTGVYIAISLYIPHHLQWRGIRLVLNLLMDMYFAEHINYEDNTPLLNEREDISPYFNLLRGYEKQLVEEPEAKSCLLQLPYMPKVFPYADLSEIDKYFHFPYIPEFANLQDVVFLRKEFVEDPRAYSIDFLFPEYRIPQQNASTQSASNEGVSRFLINSANMKILAFMKNGRDVGASYVNETFSDDDAIELLLEKSRYYQMFSFNDTIKKAVRKGYVKKIEGNYVLSDIPFSSRDFKVYVQTPQQEFQKYISFLSLESSNFKAKLYSDSKGYYFLFKGEEARNIFNISYNGIVFKSNYMVDDRAPLSISFEKYQFTIVSNQIVPIALKINGILFSKSLRSDAPIDIVLPEHLYHFEFEDLENQRVISISKSGEVNFEVAANGQNPQMIASQSPTRATTQELALVDEKRTNTQGQEEDGQLSKSRFLWWKIASIIVFVLALVGIGYWFILPMFKDPTKAYVHFISDSRIKEIYFLTNIDERTYEIDRTCIRLKKSIPIAETKLIIDFDDEGKDTLTLVQEQLNELAQLIEKGKKDTLQIELLSPARAFLSEVSHWKETHADPKGSLFWAEAKKRNFLTENLRPEFEKVVWENFLKVFDYSAYNSEQVDSLLSPYLKGGTDELKIYQAKLRQIIDDSKAREQEEEVEEAPKKRIIDSPKSLMKESKSEKLPSSKNTSHIPVEKTPSVEQVEKQTERLERIETPSDTRDSKTITRRNKRGVRPQASNVKLTEEFISDLKRFNSQLCSEEIVNKVKVAIKRLDTKDWEVVVYEFNQGKNEIEERANQYSIFFGALKKGTSIDQVKPSLFAGQSSLIHFLKKGNNFDLVKGKTQLKTFADIRQAIINTGIDPKLIR